MTAGGSGDGLGSKHPVKIFANIFISFIGAGVLGLPFAFKEAGILEGTFIMTFVGIISVKAMLLIIQCKYRLLEKHKISEKDKEKIMPKLTNGKLSPSSALDGGAETFTDVKQEEKASLMENEEKAAGDLQIEIICPEEFHKRADLSYGDVGYHAMGHTGRLLVDLAIVVSQTGFCCAYLIFISENLSDYFPKVRLVHWLCLLLPPLCLMTLLRHLGSLAMTSLLAQCSNLMAFAVVFWFDFEHLYNIEVHPKKMKLKGLPFFLAISIYCYEGAGMILSLESSLAEEVRHKFKRFFVSTMVIVTSLYISFGSCGYWSFGPETNPIITLNLPKGDSIDSAMIVKSCLCLALFFTYPVMMFPVMKILEGYLIVKPTENMMKGNILRISMVLITGLVVLLIPSFSNLMALVGSSCCTLLAFILPGLFHMAIFKGSLTKCQIMLDWALIAIGIIGSVVGTLDSLKRMSTTPPDHQVIMKDLNITETTVAAVARALTTVATNVTQGVPNNVTDS